MSIIDDAINRLQAIALLYVDPSTSKPLIKAAPDYPVGDASVIPLAIAHIADGSLNVDNASDARLLLTVHVDVHFNRQSIKDSYTKIDKFIPDYLQRLAGDPTLNGKVDTINFPVYFTVSPADWGSITTQMVSFQIPLKFKESPTAP